MVSTTHYSNNIALFQERFEKLNGKVVLANSLEDAALKIVNLVASYGGKIVYMSKLFEGVEEGVKKALSGQGFVVADYQSLENPLEAVKKADVGITTAIAAVAETGTVVEVAYDDLDRLASSMPKTHIVLVKSSSIVKTVYQLADIVKEYLKAPTSAITLISGPSRSGDIEQRLVVGIHGPHVVVAVILQWL